jgi:hypothetical protein
MSKKVNKNSLVRLMNCSKLIEAVDKINALRIKFNLDDEIVVNKKIKIVYKRFNAYIYVNNNKYIRITGGKTLPGISQIISSIITGGSLGIFDKTSVIEIVAPDNKVHEKDFYKDIEKQIVSFYPKYKTKVEKESEEKWMTEEDKEAEEKARKEFAKNMSEAYDRINNK